MRAPFVAGILGGVSILGTAIATEAPAPGTTVPQSPGLVERVTVRLIQLNVLAVHDDGRPVRDLRADEIELFVDGKPTPVAFLQPYTTPSVDVLATPKPRGEAPEPSADVAPPAPSPASAGRWFVFVFDHINASPRTRLHSVKAAREFLGARMREGDRVALAVYDSRLRFLQNFTADPQPLLDALDRLETETPRASRDRTRSIDLLVGELRGCSALGGASAERCAETVIASYEDERIRELGSFAGALRWILYAIASIPDAKSVVVFSEGVSRVPSRDGADAADAVLGSQSGRLTGPRSRFEAEERFDGIAEAASLAKATVYTVNPGGAARLSSISAATQGPVGAGNALQIDPWRSAERNAQQSLHEISWRTGGVALQGADVFDALQSVDAMSTAGYTLGYYVPENAPADQKVKIRIKRKDVKAQFPRDVPLPPPDRQELRGELTGEAGPCEDAGRRSVLLRLRLDRSSLSFTRVAGKYVANFSVLLRLSDPSGGPVRFDDFRTLNVSESPQAHESGTGADPVVEHRLLLPCRPLTATAVVSDAGSGARRDFTTDVDD